MLLAYFSGLLASLSGCTLPVLSIIASQIFVSRKFKPMKFVFTFFLTQFLIFSLINLFVASFYNIFKNLQPVFLLIAGLVTLALAISIYYGKQLLSPSGSIFAIAFAPCNIGFAIFQAASSYTYVKAITNAFAFSLGIITPILLVVFLLKDLPSRTGTKLQLLERISFYLLLAVSYYLAYLAGSSWRWWP